MPSIIVDPSLSESESPASAFAAGQTHAPNGNSNGGALGAALAPAAKPAAGEVLSIADADRFAASIRPSWEPPPGSEPTPAPTGRESAPDAVGEGVSLPGSRRSGLLITGAAVLSFLALGALALSSSTPDVSPRRDLPARPSASAPKPVPAPAPAASAPAAPAPEPALAAEQAAPPSEAAAPLPAPATQEPVANPAAPSMAAAPSQPDPALAPIAPTAEPAAAAVAAAPAAPTPAIAAPTPPPASTPPAAPSPATVHVEISATPKHAEITLDGRTIPNPFEADVVASGKHRVEAVAAGHRSADVTIGFDQDQKLALRLERLSPPKPRVKPERPRATRVKDEPAKSSRGAGFVSESPY